MKSAKMIRSRQPRNGQERCPSEQLECVRPAALFRERAEARALLSMAGELTLHESVDALQVAAVVSGLVDEIGQDAVQLILAEAFARAHG